MNINETIPSTDTSTATRNSRAPLAIAVLVKFLAASISLAQPQSVLVNGGFELPVIATNSLLAVTSGKPVLPGWESYATNGNVPALVNGCDSPYLICPLEGDQYVILNMNQETAGGMIAQSFGTGIGQSYAVQFNIGELGSVPPGTAQVSATATSQGGVVLGSLSATWSSSGWGPTNTFFFTAITPASEITFQDTTPDAPPADLALDNVSVVPIPARVAAATASVVNGFVVGASVTDSGMGYTNVPLVRIIGGGGTGAQAAALVSNSVVVAVNVSAAGSGYTSPPVVVIAPPFIPRPTMSITALLFGPLATPVMRLDFTELSPYDHYQLQFSPVAGGAWIDLGAPFIPTAATNAQYANAIGGVGFFRVEYVP